MDGLTSYATRAKSIDGTNLSHTGDLNHMSTIFTGKEVSLMEHTNEALFEIETLLYTAAEIEPVGGGGSSNCNCNSNSNGSSEELLA